MAIEIGDLLISMGADVARLQSDMGKATKMVDGAMGQISRSADFAKKALGLIGVGISVDAFSGFIKSSIDAQDEIGNMSKKTGIAAQDLFGLKFAADQNGTSLELVSKASKELAVNISTTPEKFARLGITAKDATGALIQVADIVAKMPDGMQKTAFLADIMGKKIGPEMAEFLSQGGAALQNYIDRGKDIYGVTNENVAQAKEFNDQISELQARSSGFGMSLANNLLPNMVETATRMNELAQQGHPVLALWRGLAGMGQVPWDLLIPPENLKKSLSSDGMIKDLEKELADLKGKLDLTTGDHEGWINRQLFGDPKDIVAQIKMIEQRIATIRTHAKELDKPPTKQESPTSNNTNLTDAADAAIERERAKYEKLHQMGLEFNATEADRVSWKLAFDLQAMQKEHMAGQELYGKNAEMEKAYQAARLERTQLAEAEIAKITKDAADKKYKQDQDKIRSELSIANFSKLLRQGDFTDAMSMAEKMTAGLASKSRAAFEVNKAASLAKATVQGYQMIQAAAADGSSWGGYYGAIAEGALAAAYVAANLDAINSTQFGGSGGVSAPSGGGGIPSQATSPGVPVTNTDQQQAPQPVTVNIYNTGNLLSADYVQGTIIPQIQNAVTNNDIVIIDPRSRQAKMLGAA